MMAIPIELVRKEILGNRAACLIWFDLSLPGRLDWHGLGQQLISIGWLLLFHKKSGSHGVQNVKPYNEHAYNKVF